MTALFGVHPLGCQTEFGEHSEHPKGWTPKRRVFDSRHSAFDYYFKALLCVFWASLHRQAHIDSAPPQPTGAKHSSDHNANQRWRR